MSPGFQYLTSRGNLSYLNGGGKAIDKMLKICLEGLIDLIPEFLISMHYFMWLPMGAEMARQFCLGLGQRW